MTLLEAAKLAAKWMEFWLDEDECDCDGEGGVAHGQCGKDARTRELNEIKAAIALEEANGSA
jgi:hypothetical protein